VARPGHPDAERKRLIRLLVTDVTLLRTEEHIHADIRLPGGQLHQLTVPRPRTAWEQHTTPAATLAMIEQLTAEHTFDEAVTILNGRGLTGGWGKPFSVESLRALCRAHSIPSLRDRLKTAGMLTLAQIADNLGAAPATIKNWQRLGLITGRRVDGRREYLYHPAQHCPPDNPRRDATLARYRKLSDANATISPAQQSRGHQALAARAVTSSTEGAV